MSHTAQIILVAILILLNSYFVASEFALVSVRKTRIDELVRKGNKRAKLVQKAIENVDRYISATQLGVTVASLLLGWIGEPAIASSLEPHLTFLPESAVYFSVHTIAAVIAFICITFLEIVLGELAPKTIALEKAERISLLIITPLNFFTKVFRPVIWILNIAGNSVVRLFGFRVSLRDQEVHSEEEIKMLLNQSAEQGIINRKEAEMVYSVFNLGDTPVQHIMTPRTKMIVFNSSDDLREVLKKIQEHHHSRYPVFERSIDSVIGFVHVKDIYQYVLKSGDDKKLSEIGVIRKILYVPEMKRVDEAIIDMRRRRIHIALVNDEYGGTAGLVTLEDMMESLVGEIQDEFEEPFNEIEKQSDGSFLVDGVATVDRIQRIFNLPIHGQGYATIGGLVFGLLGREPREGDKLQIGNINVEVKKIEGKQIKVLRLKTAPKSELDLS